MSEYRIDRKQELRQRLKAFAEQEAELEALVQDLDAYEKAQQTAQDVEARLKTKGIDVTQQEYAQEAKKFVDELLNNLGKKAQQKKERQAYILEKIGKVSKHLGKIAAIASVVAAVGVPAYITAQNWNSRDKALAALAKYDKPTKINNLREREEILYHLDEIIEEHGSDVSSDQEAKDYLRFLETKAYSIKEGARMLDTYGKIVDPDAAKFVMENYELLQSYEGIKPNQKACLTALAEQNIYSPLPSNIILEIVKLSAEGYCK